MGQLPYVVSLGFLLSPLAIARLVAIDVAL